MIHIGDTICIDVWRRAWRQRSTSRRRDQRFCSSAYGDEVATNINFSSTTRGDEKRRRGDYLSPVACRLVAARLGLRV